MITGPQIYKGVSLEADQKDYQYEEVDTYSSRLPGTAYEFQCKGARPSF